MVFVCSCCHYTTYVKANFHKHNLSQKHLLKYQNESKTGVYTKSINDTVEKGKKSTQSHPKVIPKSTASYSCKYCEQGFKFKQSMYRHIKYSCTKSKDEDLKELVRLMNLQLESEREQRKEVQKQLQTQAKQIEKLMGKLEIHGSFNNNTINNYTLLACRETDFSHITQE